MGENLQLVNDIADGNDEGKVLLIKGIIHAAQ